MRSRGEIKWRGEDAFVSEALVGELVGLAELETGDHVVRFCAHSLAASGGHSSAPPMAFR